ncbi:MAG: glycosyltransferase family 4 protein [Cyanobacteria bacterium SID2]|nr:glycosyltransferase family 4 protein [Cyanobacteria bacterium SID2]
MSKFALNASGYHYAKFDGLNRYTGELLKTFLKSGIRDFKIYTSDSFLFENYIQNISKIPFKNIDRNDFKNNLLRLIWHQTLLPISLKKRSISLFYSPVPEGMLFPVCPQIITVHDILPVLFPETYPRIKYYFQYILPQLLKVSQAIITTSENTKKDIDSRFKLKNKPIYVVYQGYRKEIFNIKKPADRASILQHYNLQNFILCVGETRPYKNIRRLIEAFARANVPDLDLAIVGKLNKLDRSIVDYPKAFGIVDRVKFLGFVPDNALADLYRTAIAFVFPSLYEGFGIPPLEAMACGCPVVVSHAASIPEVCNNAAEYVDPLNVDSIAAGIYRVATDANARSTLRQRGLDRVKAFSYRQMFAEILEILREYEPN